MKEKIENLNVMIDDYVSHKTDLAAAEAVLKAKQEMVAFIVESISRYEQIAIYAGVVRELVEKYGQVSKEVAELEQIVNELKSRDKGFESARKDVVAELQDDELANQK